MKKHLKVGGVCPLVQYPSQVAQVERQQGSSLNWEARGDWAFGAEAHHASPSTLGLVLATA